MPTLSIPDLDTLANLLGLPKFVLTRFVFHADRFYKRFCIRKRSGHGYRIICAPSRELKGIQRWILTFILRAVPLPEVCTAFRKGRSILDNARPHVDKDFVYNVDLKDFFPTITLPRVIGLFKALGYPPAVAFALGKLTTYAGKLPQGAPTSPDLANLICRQLDARLAGLCAKRGWSYTRYSDDLTVSGAGGIDSARRAVAEIIADEGFQVNPRKVRTVRRKGRQVVTGLVVNRGVNIARHRRKLWRALFRQADLEPGKFVPRYAELQGYVAFLQMVRPADTALPVYRAVLAKLQTEAAKQSTRAQDH
jgi:retron-type reverse transcriptase